MKRIAMATLAGILLQFSPAAEAQTVNCGAFPAYWFVGYPCNVTVSGGDVTIALNTSSGCGGSLVGNYTIERKRYDDTPKDGHRWDYSDFERTLGLIMSNRSKKMGVAIQCDSVRAVRFY